MWEKIEIKKNSEEAEIRYKNLAGSLLFLSSSNKNNNRLIGLYFNISFIKKDTSLLEYLQELKTEHCYKIINTKSSDEVYYHLIIAPSNSNQKDELYEIIDKMEKFKILPNDAMYHFVNFCEQSDKIKPRSL